MSNRLGWGWRRVAEITRGWGTARRGLRESTVSSVVSREDRGRCHCCLQLPHGGCRQGEAKLFSDMRIERTRGSGQKLKHGKFWSETRKKNLWACTGQGPKEVVGCPSLEIFNITGWSLSNFVNFEVDHALRRSLYLQRSLPSYLFYDNMKNFECNACITVILCSKYIGSKDISRLTWMVLFLQQLLWW